MMLLYHFTAKEYLPAIAAGGLTLGEVPLSPSKILNAVWLTTDGMADGHGLSDGRDLTDREKLNAGIPLTSNARFANKRALRLTVRIPRGDRNLVGWTAWGRRRLAPDWFDRLSSTGGGKHRTWFLYWGVIPPEWIQEVRDLTTDTILLDWQSATLEQTLMNASIRVTPVIAEAKH